MLCVLVQVLLLGFTACKLGELWLDVTHSPDGWGEQLELRSLMRQAQQSSFVNRGLTFAFGETAMFAEGESLGSISAKWSKTYSSIQHDPFL